MHESNAHLDALIAVARAVEIDHHVGIHLGIGIYNLGAIISRERCVQEGNLLNLHMQIFPLTGMFKGISVSMFSWSAAPVHVLTTLDAS